nr:2-octaprenyl-6-methoxyphenyl hydroxylase [Marinibactrum halimedae]
MVGATLALLLANAEPRWQITLFERYALPLENEPAKQPSFDERSTALSFGSTTILNALGIWDTLESLITPIDTVHVSDAGHIGGTRLQAKAQQVPALGYVIENRHLGQTLMQQVMHCDNINFIAPACVTQLTPKPNGFYLSWSQDEGDSNSLHSLEPDLVIVADGAHSPLRKQLGIDTAQHDYDQTGIIANVGFTQPHKGVAYERFTPKGPLALLPLGQSPNGKTSALVWTRPKIDAESLLKCSEAQFLDQLQADFGWRLGRFTRVSPRHAYPLSLILAKEQVRQHLVVVGNAAHFLHPVAGQGFNLALRDCARLAAVLAEGWKNNPITFAKLNNLQRYVDQQHTDQLTTIGFSHNLVKLFSSDHLVYAGLRQLGLLALDTTATGQSAFARQAMGVGGAFSL